MPVARMRMRQWLQEKIESNSVTGLTWMDKDKTMFSIPWKHAARHGWEMEKDASLFKQWAIHTGKYVEGQTRDPKTWKANFRCAMNSLPDIEEVKDKSINKGHQAVRVFRMLPSSPKSREKRSKSKETKPRKRPLQTSMIKIEEEADCSNTQFPMNDSTQEDTSSTQENTVDSTVHTEQPDFSFMTPAEVPDFSLSVEVGSCFPFSHRFEVSPAHSEELCDDIIQICQQLERDSIFMTSSFDDKGFLSNEVCTSPESHWSDSSSVDELDDLPQYTTLGSDSTDNLWNNMFQIMSMH